MIPNNHKIIVISSGLGGILLAYLLYPEFLGDDTFIHMGFIKDLTTGKGFSFTGTKTNGSTSPMWVFFGAIVSKIFFSPEISLRILSGFFTLTTVYLLYKVLSRNNIDNKILYAALFSLVLNPFFLRWSLSGMEVTASMSLLLLLFHLLDVKNNKRSWIWGGILFGLSILVRPEFFGFFIIFFLYSIFTQPNRRGYLTIASVIAIAIIVGWLLFTYFYFGSIIPNTYLWKAGGDLFGFKYNYVIRTIKLLLAGNLAEFSLLVILLLTLILNSVRKTNKNLNFNLLFTTLKENRLLLTILWITVFYGFYILKDVTVISRYSLILVPFIILLAISLFRKFEESLTSKIKNLILAAYIIIIFIGYGIITFYIVKPASDAFVNGFQNSYKEIASIIKEDSQNLFSSVALTDVGIIGYYSGAKVYDFAGLVDDSRFNFSNVRDYLITKKAEYLVLREEYSLKDVLPGGISYEILYEKRIAGFGINHSNPRTVTLYKLSW